MSTSETSFFVHVDKKTGGATFRQFVGCLGGLPNVQFVKRYVCHWGEFGLVRATLEALGEALRNEPAPDHVVLLTGQDYPIKTADEIDRFFENSRGRSYMNCERVPSCRWAQADPRIKHWQVRLLGRGVVFPQRDLGLAALLSPKKWPVVVISYLLPRERSFPKGFRPFTGSAYWAMSAEAARAVHDLACSDRRFLRYFTYVCCPDELFFQTALMSSEFAGEVTDTDLHYIDWSQGGAHPATLTVSDIDRLADSRELFARKFDSDVDEDILRLIDDRLLGQGAQ